MNRIIVIILLLCSFDGWSQQNPVLSQYMHHALPLNPAFAGSSEAATFAASYRKQWAGFEGAPNTQMFSAHAPLQNGKLGAGLMVWKDQFGVSKSNKVGSSFVYQMPMQGAKLSLGLSLIVEFGKDSWSEVVTTEENDPQFSSGDQNYVLPDAGFGLYYRRKKAYVSLSSPSLLTRSYEASQGYHANFDFEQTPFYLNVGGEFLISPSVALRPSLLISTTANQWQQTDLNLIVRYDSRFELGASYRLQNAVVGLIRYHVTRQLSFAYAYDHWMSPIAAYQNGSHEITIRYDLIFEQNASNPRFF